MKARSIIQPKAGTYVFILGLLIVIFGIVAPIFKVPLYAGVVGVTLNVSPTSVPQGTSAHFIGLGYTAGKGAYVFLQQGTQNSQIIASPTALSDGTWAFDTGFPASFPLGSYSVWAVDITTNQTSPRVALQIVALGTQVTSTTTSQSSTVAQSSTTSSAVSSTVQTTTVVLTTSTSNANSQATTMTTTSGNSVLTQTTTPNNLPATTTLVLTQTLSPLTGLLPSSFSSTSIITVIIGGIFSVAGLASNLAQPMKRRR